MMIGSPGTAGATAETGLPIPRSRVHGISAPEFGSVLRAANSGSRRRKHGCEQSQADPGRPRGTVRRTFRREVSLQIRVTEWARAFLSAPVHPSEGAGLSPSGEGAVFGIPRERPPHSPRRQFIGSALSSTPALAVNRRMRHTGTSARPFGGPEASLRHLV